MIQEPAELLGPLGGIADMGLDGDDDLGVGRDLGPHAQAVNKDFLHGVELTWLAILAAMVATPFWLEWRDGTPGVLVDSKTYNLVRVAFSPDSKTVISSGWDDTIRIWDLPGGKETRRWGRLEDREVEGRTCVQL